MNTSFAGDEDEESHLLENVRGQFAVPDPNPNNRKETPPEASYRPFLRVISLGLVVSVCTMLGYTKSLMKLAVPPDPDVFAFKESVDQLSAADFMKLENSKQFLEFRRYATKFNREYNTKSDTDHEVQTRFSNFKENMNKAAALCVSNTVTGSFGANKFSDFSVEERNMMKGYVIPKQQRDEAQLIELGLPAYSADAEDLKNNHVEAMKKSYDDNVITMPSTNSFQKRGAAKVIEILDKIDEKEENVTDAKKVERDRNRSRAENEEQEKASAKKHIAGIKDAISKVPLTPEQIKKSGAGNKHGLVDWRGVLTTTNILDQGHCMACWAISAVNQLESDSIRNGLLTPNDQLSIQGQLSCDTINHGCAGGAPNLAYDYMYLVGGVEARLDYWDGEFHSGNEPKANSIKCKVKDYTDPKQAPKKVTASAYFNVKDEAAMIQHVTNTGPLSVCLDADCFTYYTGGIISGPECSGTPNHCITVVGINNASEGIDENGNEVIPYWIVRNSWGKDWGHGGYAYIAAGGDHCRITNAATFVSAAKPHAIPA